MTTSEQKIRSAGGRMTKVRAAIIEILTTHGCIVDRAHLAKLLTQRDLRPNRSTLYRELQFLVSHNIVQEVVIGGVTYFEMPQKHHHHAVCMQCHAIEMVPMEHHLNTEEQQIAQNTKFHITHHTLDFYGYCPKCQ
jgi:Fur family ferric uptake transcriptional regulator